MNETYTKARFWKVEKRRLISGKLNMDFEVIYA